MGPEATAAYVESLSLPKEFRHTIATHELKCQALLAMSLEDLEWHLHVGTEPLPAWSAADVQRWVRDVVRLPDHAPAFAGVDGPSLLSILKDKSPMPGGLSNKDDTSKEQLHRLLAKLSKVPKEASGTNTQAKVALQVLLNKDLLHHGETIPGAAALAGKVVGVFFSAGWCGPCKEFQPKLEALHAKLQAEGKAFEVALPYTLMWGVASLFLSVLDPGVEGGVSLG